MRPVDVLDYPAVIAALEKQAPLWPPGTAHGYHARTFGFLLDELVRRIAGITMSEYWRKTFADPLDLDIWIGLPDSNKTAWRRSTQRRLEARRLRQNFIETSPRLERWREKLSPLRADCMP